MAHSSYNFTQIESVTCPISRTMIQGDKIITVMNPGAHTTDKEGFNTLHAEIVDKEVALNQRLAGELEQALVALEHDPWLEQVHRDELAISDLVRVLSGDVVDLHDAMLIGQLEPVDLFDTTPVQRRDLTAPVLTRVGVTRHDELTDGDLPDGSELPVAHLHRGLVREGAPLARSVEVLRAKPQPHGGSRAGRERDEERGDVEGQLSTKTSDNNRYVYI